MKEFEESASSEKVIAPHKARILIIVGAVVLLHALLLFLFWPHRWPTSYKWLLLPDSVSAYFLLAFGFEQRIRSKSKQEGPQGAEKVTES